MIVTGRTMRRHSGDLPALRIEVLIDMKFVARRGTRAARRVCLGGAGRVSKKQADAHAESEYEQFAAHRRALLEAEGAEFSVGALEDAAKALPTPGKKRT